jgi:hypothetical protein
LHGLRQGQAESLIGYNAFGVASIHVDTGEAGIVAEVLAAGAAVVATAAASPEPRDPDAASRGKAPGGRAVGYHGAYDLVTQDKGQTRCGKLPVGYVEVRAAHAAGPDT